MFQHTPSVSCNPLHKTDHYRCYIATSVAPATPLIQLFRVDHIDCGLFMLEVFQFHHPRWAYTLFGLAAAFTVGLAHPNSLFATLLLHLPLLKLLESTYSCSVDFCDIPLSACCCSNQSCGSFWHYPCALCLGPVEVFCDIPLSASATFLCRLLPRSFEDLFLCSNHSWVRINSFWHYSCALVYL